MCHCWQGAAGAVVEASLGCGGGADGEAAPTTPGHGRAAADSNPNLLCAGSLSGRRPGCMFWAWIEEGLFASECNRCGAFLAQQGPH